MQYKHIKNTNTMKKLIFTLLISFFALNAVAQKDVTKFLGIPVDGTKAEMIRKLKAKGFKSTTYDRGILEGEFNGYDVRIHIVTTNNKVSRIMVCDKNNVDESTIRIRFNNLCYQFNNNSKYITFKDFTIPDSEDISYNISVNNKRYEAIFYQLINNHKEIVFNELTPYLKDKYSEEELANPSKKTREEAEELIYDFLLDKSSKKSVWFMISEYYGKFGITMYYDNEYNRANGEDL